MSANTLDTGGIVYGKINLDGQDYYKKPLGTGAFSEVYAIYRAKEDGSIDENTPPQVIKIYKKIGGRAWKTTAKEALQEAKILKVQFPTEVYQLDDQATGYRRLTEQADIGNTPVLMLMPKFPGQPILSSTGKPHPKLAKLTPLQRLQLAALVIKTLMDLPVDFIDLKPENILIDIQIDEKTGEASFECHLIDFAGYDRTVMTAAPEWNGYNSQCDLFLMPKINEETLQLANIENAVILTDDNDAHFMIAGKLDKETTVANIDRQGLEPCKEMMVANIDQQGLEPCEGFIRIQNPQASKIIAEAARKSNYGLGNHDKKMEIYSTLSVLAPMLGETDVYRNKKILNKNQIKETKQAPFCLENMTMFLWEITTTEESWNTAIRNVSRTLHAMQNPEPERRPSYQEIYTILIEAISVLQHNLRTTSPMFEEDFSEKEKPSRDDSSSDSEKSEEIASDRQSLSSEERDRNSFDSISNSLRFFSRSFSSSFSHFSFGGFGNTESAPTTPLKHRRLNNSPTQER